MASGSTSIFKSFVKNSVGYFVKKVSKEAMLKDFKNAVLFSVVHLGIDLTFESIRNKEIGADASYALTVIVENTLWMSKLDNSDVSAPRNLNAPSIVKEEEEEDKMDPIILNVFKTDPKFSL